jgi:RHS repeat-associated protein
MAALTRAPFDHDYLPFGEEIPSGIGGRIGGPTGCYGAGQYPSSPDVTSVKFTGKERDSETGLDYFEHRYFSAAQGRFTSPDPLNWLASQNGNDHDRQQFQAYIGDPQNLNLYAPDPTAGARSISNGTATLGYCYAA